MNESPVLVHVWEVDPAEEAVAVQRLNETFGEIVKVLSAVEFGHETGGVRRSPWGCVRWRWETVSS